MNSSFFSRILMFLHIFVAFVLMGGCAAPTDSTYLDDTGYEVEASPKTVASNGFTYPISGLTSWSNGNYGACGSYYFSGYCHVGNDLIYARGTMVSSIAAGTVLGVSGTQNAVCSSGWGYDSSTTSGGTNTCNMSVAVQHYDDDGTPFVVVYGHLVYNSSIRAGDIYIPGQTIGQIANWYYCRSYTSTSSCSGGWTDGADHLHFGIRPGTTLSYTGYVSCSVSQAASASLPTGCSSSSFTAPGTYMNTSGRNWVAPPSVPTLTYPITGTTMSSPVYLRWTNGSGTYRSHILICMDSAFTWGCVNPDGGIIGVETTGTGASRSTSYNATLSSGITYYWKVQGSAYTDYGGWGSYSSARSFTVR